MSGTRMHITVPEQLAEFAQRRVASGNFTTPSDYVRYLIREDREREVAKLNQMIQEGIDSGVSKTPPEKFFAQLAKDIDKAYSTKTRKK